MVSRLYGAIVNARNALYQKGVFKSFSLGAKTISIGNITVGGTGKTPLVAFAAEILTADGEKVCVLTRGYGRKNPKQRILVSDGEKILADVEFTGDEPYELAEKLLGKAIIIGDANRLAAGVWARKKFGITAFVLDDAFQHRRVRRDLNIVCIDATNPFGNEKLLPSGILRESPANLKRADAIVITRANLVVDVSNLKSQIKKFNSDCSIFVSENKISRLFNLKDFPAEKQNGQQNTIDQRRTAENYMAFCALGNPDNFFEQLRREEFKLTGTHAFPDHHFYAQKDIEKLSEMAVQNKAEILITTAKDAVKLKDLKFDLPCYVVENKMLFDNESEFRKLLLSAGQGAGNRK